MVEEAVVPEQPYSVEEPASGDEGPHPEAGDAAVEVEAPTGLLSIIPQLIPQHFQHS